MAYCDGCQKELPLKGDMHFDELGYPVQACTRNNATSSIQQFLDDMGIVYMEEQERLFP